MDRKQVLIPEEQTLRQRDFERKIKELHAQRGKNVRVCVFNSGSFIDESDSEAIWKSFYRADKARNTYAPDDCADLAALVRGTIPEERISLLLSAAQNACRQSIRQDPVEMTDEYLAVIDEVERRIAEAQTVDICFAYWHLKAMFLWEHDIPWRSPAALNPNVMFD